MNNTCKRIKEIKNRNRKQGARMPVKNAPGSQAKNLIARN